MAELVKQLVGEMEESIGYKGMKNATIYKWLSIDK